MMEDQITEFRIKIREALKGFIGENIKVPILESMLLKDMDDLLKKDQNITEFKIEISVDPEIEGKVNIQIIPQTLLSKAVVNYLNDKDN